MKKSLIEIPQVLRSLATSMPPSVSSCKLEIPQVLRTLASALFVVLTLCAGPQSRAEEKPRIDWQPWSDKVFAQAAAEHKFVLLDLGAGWCHWCHVMDELTYSDPKVIALLRSKYIAVRVDQDARPDLSNRYEDYGWPATVVFNAQRGEIVKRRGYIPPRPMESLLQAIIDDPTPGPSVEPEPVLSAATDASLTKEQRTAMRAAFLKAYDPKLGGWGDVHKYLNWDALEYCITEGAAGDGAMEKMAQQTLTNGVTLLDPVWGGVYQYSTDGDWDHPHFEKIMPFQTENMRVFALAAKTWHEPKWLENARTTRGYLKTFLTSPEGAFYTSQDADLVEGEHGRNYFALDDAARRKRGIPRVDTHLYARENGLAITGLASLYAASGDGAVLEDAWRAAVWVMKQRSLPNGGFSHDEKDAAGPYLADTLDMARAFLSLYTVTAERDWLARAEASAAFIDSKFRAQIGFATAVPPVAGALPSMPQLDENVALTRFAILLHNHTGKKPWKEMAEHAMRYLAAPATVERQGFSTSGILLADLAMRMEPAHITVVGHKDDAAAKALFAAALRGAPDAARIEWLDAREGPLPNPDVRYPEMAQAGAFVCAGGSCSMPMQSPEQLAKKLADLKR